MPQQSHMQIRGGRGGGKGHGKTKRFQVISKHKETRDVLNQEFAPFLYRIPLMKDAIDAVVEMSLKSWTFK